MNAKVKKKKAKKITDLVETIKPEDIKLVPMQETAITPMAMLQMAVQQNADLDKMQQLMDLQERWEKNEARKAYVVAMNAFKADPPEIFKDRHVEFETSKGVTAYDHASLANIVKVIGEKLAQHGLSHHWDTNQLDGGQVRVTCVITHELGHSEKVPLQAGLDQSGGKNNIQALGSTVSYLQRYTLLSATGLATKDMDDDGATGGEKPAETSQAAELPDYPEKMLKDNLEKWKKYIKDGKSSAPHIVSMVSVKYKLSTKQKLAIANLEPQGDK